MLQSQGSRAVDIKNAIQKQVGTCSSFCWESEGSFARKGEPCEKPRPKKPVFCWFVRCRSVFGAPLLLDVKGLQLHKILHKRFFLCIMRIDSKTLLKLSVYYIFRCMLVFISTFRFILQYSYTVYEFNYTCLQNRNDRTWKLLEYPIYLLVSAIHRNRTCRFVETSQAFRFSEVSPGITRRSNPRIFRAPIYDIYIYGWLLKWWYPQSPPQNDHF